MCFGPVVRVFMRVAAVVCFLPDAALAQPAPSLTPQIGAELEALFAGATPDLTLDSAQINAAAIDARVCVDAATCFQAHVAPTGDTCPTSVGVGWCLTWTGEPQPSPHLQARILERLRRLHLPPQRPTPTPGQAAATTVSGDPAVAWLLVALLGCGLARWHWRTRARWLDPGVALLVVTTSFVLPLQVLANFASESDAWPRGSPAPWLVVWLLLPLLTGQLSAHVLSRWLVRIPVRPLARAWLGVLPVVVALVVVAPQWGRLDVATLGLSHAAVFLLAYPPRPHAAQRLLLTLGTLVVAVGLMQAGVLLFLPRPQTMVADRQPFIVGATPRPDGLPVSQPERWADCALYAEPGPATLACLRLDQPPPGPWLLHLGDSMVFGSGLPAEFALPAQFQRHLPRVQHLNAGVPATSLDIQWALLGRLLGRATPSAVVVYVTPVNDLEPQLLLESCGGTPAVDLQAGAPHLRCAEAAFQRRSLLRQLLISPLPFAVRALGGSVAFADALIAWHTTAVDRTVRWMDAAAATEVLPLYRALALAVVAQLRESRVPLRVVLMPTRRSLAVGDTTARASLREAWQQAGAEVVDANPAIAFASLVLGEGAVYLPGSGEIHLSAQGNDLLARALAPGLEALLHTGRLNPPSARGMPAQAD